MAMPPIPNATAAEQRHSLILRITHWAMAICFLFMWSSGYIMRNWMDPDSPAQEAVYDLHKSVGVTLLILLILRICARALSRVPPLPAAIAAWERRAARFGHLGLYGLMTLALATGWALTDFGGHGVVWFGVPMPQLFPVSETMFGMKLDPLTSDIHAWFVYGLLALVAVHVGAVIKHHRRDGLDLLPRIAIRLVARLGGVESGPGGPTSR